jgi:hypothetical protein
MAWDVIFYETAEGPLPGADFLDGCPAKIRGTILAVLDAVAAAPPPAFSGGGKWEAMHGDMGGYYEIRVTGPGREQFRLFCLLENADKRTLTRLCKSSAAWQRLHRADTPANRIKYIAESCQIAL